MIRAVVDTNVFVSALISPSGNEALILLAVRHGLLKPYFSTEPSGVCGSAGPTKIWHGELPRV